MLSIRHALLIAGTLCSIFLLLSLQFNYQNPVDFEEAPTLRHGPQPMATGKILPDPHEPLALGEGIQSEDTAPALDDSQDPLSFRESVAQATDFHVHSPTLTFDRIYVVSLPTRQDRRTTMSRVAAALNLQFTFVDAVLKDSPLIQWIAEHVRQVRQKKRPFLAQALRVPEDEVGGMGIDSIWLARSGQRSEHGVLRLPPIEDWVAVLDEATPVGGTPTKLEEPLEDRLKPQDPQFNISKALYDPVEEMESRQVVPGVLSTWFSHTRAIKTMLANGDESALFLEDDVDIEWDVEKKWASIRRSLPEDWEAVFLGHCWGREMTLPTQLHPHLFHSSSPRCLHGYALSRKGAQHLIDLLSDPWVAYQAPVDVTLPTFAAAGIMAPYSVEPPLIIQSKDSPSDIQPGTGSPWRGLLADSTVERIWRDEEKEVPALSWEEAIKDPSVTRPRIPGWY